MCLHTPAFIMLLVTVEMTVTYQCYSSENIYMSDDDFHDFCAGLFLSNDLEFINPIMVLPESLKTPREYLVTFRCVFDYENPDDCVGIPIYRHMLHCANVTRVVQEYRTLGKSFKVDSNDDDDDAGN